VFDWEILGNLRVLFEGGDPVTLAGLVIFFVYVAWKFRKFLVAVTVCPTDVFYDLWFYHCLGRVSV
jgi:hypothetical protein